MNLEIFLHSSSQRWNILNVPVAFVFLFIWVLVMFLSLKFGFFDVFFWGAQHATVQGIDYFALPKSFLNFMNHQSLYDSWHGPVYGPYATWYLAHPLFALAVMSWFSWLSPWSSYWAFDFFSLGIMLYCGFRFAQCAESSRDTSIYYACFLVSFQLYWMLYVGNMHAVLILAEVLIFVGIFQVLEHRHALGLRALFWGLLISFFSKPLVILFIPPLLLVKETRMTLLWAVLTYSLVSLLFIVLPFLNPEAVPLGDIWGLISQMDYIKDSMNIYKNNFHLTPFMKDNAVHWLNLIAQSGHRFNHIDNFAFPVFIDALWNQRCASVWYYIPLYLSWMNGCFLFFVRDRSLRLQLLILVLLAITLCFFLSAQPVWEYQFTSIMPVMAMIYLLFQRKILSPYWAYPLMILVFFEYLPSAYFLMNADEIDASFLSFLRASRLLPILGVFVLIYLKTLFLFYRYFLKHAAQYTLWRPKAAILNSENSF